MPSLHLFETPPDESVDSQILQLVVDNLSDISAVALLPSNPLYNLYQYGVGFEAHLYLQALAGTRDLKVELLVAFDDDDPNRVIGFLLYLPLVDQPQACSVVYLAVAADRRRQGLARRLLERMTTRYPQAELACQAGRVEWFTALGFRPVGVRGPHVLMSSSGRANEGQGAMIDIEPIYRSEQVRQIHAYLLKQHGQRAMVDAEKQRDRRLDQLTRQAQALVVERLGEAALYSRAPAPRLV